MTACNLPGAGFCERAPAQDNGSHAIVTQYSFRDELPSGPPYALPLSPQTTACGERRGSSAVPSHEGGRSGLAGDRVLIAGAAAAADGADQLAALHQRKAAGRSNQGRV